MGCVVLGTHLEIMAGSLAECSDSPLLFLFFSARTTLIRFSSLRSMLYIYSIHTYTKIGIIWRIYLIKQDIFCGKTAIK